MPFGKGQAETTATCLGSPKPWFKAEIRFEPETILVCHPDYLSSKVHLSCGVNKHKRSIITKKLKHLKH